MPEDMPSTVEGERPERSPIDFEEVGEGKEYLAMVRDLGTGEMAEQTVAITCKRENETYDDTPGAKILAYEW